MNHYPRRLSTLLAIVLASLLRATANEVTLETSQFRFRMNSDGGCELLDKKASVPWGAMAAGNPFGRGTTDINGKTTSFQLTRCELHGFGGELVALFHPLPEEPNTALRIRVKVLKDPQTLEFTAEPDANFGLKTLVLLEPLLAVTDKDDAALLIPVREGLLIPADSGLGFQHRFDTYAYEGCHMAMFGVNKQGAALLVDWADPYTAVIVQSSTNSPSLPGRQQVTAGIELNKGARSLRLQPLGKGDHVAVCAAYRERAKDIGWFVPWKEKLRDNPTRKQLFGAINYKLWSTLDRRMDAESRKEESVTVNWTFEEAAQVAEHLKNELKLDRVLFTLGGWIHRGYDNQHPDILPTAPECGGDAAFADCAQRIMRLGYLLCLHDNYQDIYRDSPSWDEKYIMKSPDGKIVRGGHWAGGMAYLTCSQMALDLAKRPQNLEAVKRLSGANSYFIDTTYAAGLQECFDPAHPLKRGDDMKWKQGLSDYARHVFGVFGSECGREWAIPHSDFFEGLTGVSGGYYHDANLTAKLGGTVVPMFELVYRDTIAMYGKYGYDPDRAASYVLHHISLGRPLNYHSIPRHLYWKQQEPGEAEPLKLRPSVADIKQTGPRQFSIQYAWEVTGPTPGDDYRVFVHFTDPSGKIVFQNDHAPSPRLSEWREGTVRQGPFILAVPDEATGTYNVRVGLFDLGSGERARLQGRDTGERSYAAGGLRIDRNTIEYLPPRDGVPASGDPALFTRSKNGWAAGMHSMDCFVKNTYEILSPLNELTSALPMSSHQFLSADRHVQKTIFGQGTDAYTVVINSSQSDYTLEFPNAGKVVLPQNGFVIDGPEFVAFHASEWNSLRYSTPPIFTVRSMDGKRIDRSRKIRIFHASGDDTIRIGKETRTVQREDTIQR